MILISILKYCKEFIAKNIIPLIILHENNDFAEMFKNLDSYRSQNNSVEPSKYLYKEFK